RTRLRWRTAAKSAVSADSAALGSWPQAPLADRSPLRRIRYKVRSNRTPALRRGRRLLLESLERRSLLAGLPFGAAPEDTAEYMLGDVLVNVVLLESNGAHDVSTEDWDTQQINLVKSKIETGMAWWEETLAHFHPDAYLKFHFDFTFADQPFETAYEPIKRTSNEHELFVDEFLDAAGYTQGSISSRI